jgi:hypothetical protein
MPCTLMKYKMRQLFGEQKILLASFFNLVCFVFKIDVFLPCDKMSQEVLQPLEC